MSSTAGRALSAEAVAVPLAHVERELSRQFGLLQDKDEPPVPRVRMSNLVIYTDDPQVADSVSEQVPQIVAAHPARVLLLIADTSGPEKNVTAAVYVTGCHGSARTRACSEQVVLRASGSAVASFPFAVRAMLVGDVPVNLWWASTQPPALAGSLVYELGEYAQQIMYDSIGWPDPARGVAATAAWLERVESRVAGGRWRVASDLNWRRLKYWRRIIAQSLDAASAPGAADSITEIEVQHGPHAVIQAWELTSWIAHRLGWRLSSGKARPGVVIDWSFQSSRGEVRARVRRLDQGAPEIRGVRIVCSVAGTRAVLRAVAESDSRLSIQVEGVDATARSVSVPPITPEELVARQLSDREHDLVFHESMTVAEVLAQSLLD